MVKFSTVVTSPNGTVCTVPLRSRRRIVRIDIASTSPIWPPTRATSPTETVSSIRMNRPVMMSRTKVCDPKPIASPTTPAPASNGVMLMPIRSSTISATMTPTLTRAALRASGSRVRMRAVRGSALPSAPVLPR